MKAVFNQTNKWLSLVLSVMIISLCLSFTACKVSYGFNEKTSAIPDTIKTVKIEPLLNKAPYQNPQLTPNLTDKLRTKITNQTKLTLTNSDNAQWIISGEIRDYSVSTTGVTTGANGQQQTSINRLTVSVHITINKQVKVEEYDVSRSFDFNASLSLQAAEQGLLDDMVRNLTDEIYNKLFSNW